VLETIIRKMQSAREVVYDVETNGLNWQKCHIVGHVITFGPAEDDTYYVPVRHEGGNIADPATFEHDLYQAMRNKVVIGHNMKFDAHFANSHGAQIERYNELECTLVNQSLINEQQGKYNLAACCAAMGVPISKDDRIYEYLAQKFGGKTERNQMANFWRLSGDDPMTLSYAKADGAATWALRQRQVVELERKGLGNVVKLEKRVLRTLIRMEERGVRVNVDRLKDLRASMASRISRASEVLPEGLNVRSSQQLAKLFESQGHDPSTWPRTKPSKTHAEGQPSFVESWLETFDLGRAILDVRHLTNLTNSFVDPLLETHVNSGTWRVHTDFNQIKQDDFGTVSGRLSSSNPNLQQVPKHDKLLAPLFRDVFEADPGMKWSSNDYKQQEFVVFAILSKSQTVLDGYRSDPPVDIHSVVAEMLGVDRNTTAKRLNLGKLYGMGKAKMALALGCSEKVADELGKKWEAIMPDAKAFRSECERIVRSRYGYGANNKMMEVGYIETIFGRRRHYPEVDRSYAAMSGLIQGSCADICKDKMCEVDEYFESEGDTSHLLLQVHDSLDWQNPEGDIVQNAEAKRIMEDFSKPPYLEFNCPIRVDSGSGKTWKDASL